tara:strand:- start:798 stop:1049 length:252 start_codon:yes stop_codon:yes gene_type:complete
MMLTVDEYMALRRLIDSERESEGASLASKEQTATKKRKKRSSAKQRAYKAAFKRIAPKNKKKNGQWKTGGFQRTVKAAWRSVK